MASTCCLCHQVIETLEHADDLPFRPYCQDCAACDPTGTWSSNDAMCDACGATAHGSPDEAAALLATPAS